MKQAPLLILWSMIIVSILAFSGCTTIRMVEINDDAYKNAPRDSLTINTVCIWNNLLTLNISYGGGCKEHYFTLIATSFMESQPVQVNIVLSHKDNDDPCDMWITEDLTFTLLPLKKTWRDAYHKQSGTILMNLENYNGSLYYIF